MNPLTLRLMSVPEILQKNLNLWELPAPDAEAWKLLETTRCEDAKFDSLLESWEKTSEECDYLEFMRSVDRNMRHGARALKKFHRFNYHSTNVRWGLGSPLAACQLAYCETRMSPTRLNQDEVRQLQELVNLNPKWAFYFARVLGDHPGFDVEMAVTATKSHIFWNVALRLEIAKEDPVAVLDNVAVLLPYDPAAACAALVLLPASEAQCLLAATCLGSAPDWAFVSGNLRKNRRERCAADEEVQALLANAAMAHPRWAYYWLCYVDDRAPIEAVKALAHHPGWCAQYIHEQKLRGKSQVQILDLLAAAESRMGERFSMSDPYYSAWIFFCADLIAEGES